MTAPAVSAMHHDGEIAIATGTSRHATAWKNKTLLWSQLAARLAKTNRTGETIAEYLTLPKSRQDDIKDVGGFVGGSLKGGKRSTGTVAWRHVVTLDADFADAAFWARVQLMFPYACLIYSTHKHQPAAPRLRLVIPLARAVSPEEYLAISKRIAADIGIDLFDDTTYEPSRLMYWPSTSADAEFIFEIQDEKFLEPDEILARYDDWRDPAFWPESSRTRDKRHKRAEQQGDPLAKAGLVGTFCRTYSIPDAIAAFLPEVYEPAGPSRYTYAGGSTAGGLVLYEDKFAFSHHGTDPISGQLVNAFDLVRIHKYGAQDADLPAGTPTSKLPSYAAMVDLAGNDPEVKQQLAAEKRAEAEADFGVEGGDNWIARMKTTKGGRFADTIDNVIIVMENDPALAGKIKINGFTRQLEVTEALPWREKTGTWGDADDAALRHYFETRFGIVHAGRIADGMACVVEAATFHPVREYLAGLIWDGLPRADEVLIDYLGAEDSLYVRAVTRKFFAAAAARIFSPGCKFDFMLTLVGPQGIGKSELIKRLAKDWHSDSFSTVQGKEAYEQLQGAWIIEVAELSAARKAEVEAVKHFISKREDAYRQAYGRRVSHFPRQCVFVGTTNDPDCLRDRTGNRRFWVVDVKAERTRKNIWRHLTENEIDQIWAEAVENWRCGEALFLEGELAAEAIAQQEKHTEEQPLVGLIEEYLERRLPVDWYDRNLAARRAFLHGRGDFGEESLGKEYLTRTRTCPLEIWLELMEGDPKNLQPTMSRQILEALRQLKKWKPIGRKYFPAPCGRQRGYGTD